MIRDVISPSRSSIAVMPFNKSIFSPTLIVISLTPLISGKTLFASTTIFTLKAED